MCCRTSSEVICGSTANERNSGGCGPSVFCAQNGDGASDRAGPRCRGDAASSLPRSPLIARRRHVTDTPQLHLPLPLPPRDLPGLKPRPHLDAHAHYLALLVPAGPAPRGRHGGGLWAAAAARRMGGNGEALYVTALTSGRRPRGCGAEFGASRSAVASASPSCGHRGGNNIRVAARKWRQKEGTMAKRRMRDTAPPSKPRPQ